MIDRMKKSLNGAASLFMELIGNSIVKLLPKGDFGKNVFYALIVLFGMVGIYILLV